MMKTETLIKMANQIGDFFEAEPNKAQAEQDIALHLNKFWTKDMRNQIAEHVKSAQGVGLHAQVIAAISKHINP
jgi:formate dehydrogenase subunit delta